MIDFERKYLEAIDCISTLREACRKEGYNEVVCFIDDFFPEIKKMADAKIAMSLDMYLDWLDGCKDYAPNGAYTIKDYRTWLFKNHGTHNYNKKDAVKPKFSVGDEISNGYEYFTITDITGGKYWFNDRIICDISDQDGWRPSENQMHQLRKMITALPDGEIRVGLKSLYDDLLKLIG